MGREKQVPKEVSDAVLRGRENGSWTAMVTDGPISERE
jgi:hypothetical protein